MANYSAVRRGWAQIDRRALHPHLRFVVDGAFRYESERLARQTYGPGHAFFHPVGYRHSMSLVSEKGRLSSIHWARLGPPRAGRSDRATLLHPREVVHVGDYQRVHDLLRACSELFQGSDALQRATLVSCAKLTLLTVAEWWRRAPRRSGDPRVLEACTHIRRNAVRRVSRGELARMMHVTPQHVNLLFRTHLGMTPTAFARRERCVRAWNLLEHEGMSVQQAAERVGYDDPYYFSRTFRAVFGVPPSAVGARRSSGRSGHAEREG
jgi:AraC-like DNA-binding protein